MDLLRRAGVSICFSLVAACGAAGGGLGLLGQYDTGDLRFEEAQIDDKVVYYHQRMVDTALVEKDYIVYQFDKQTGELLARKSHWRDGVPEHLPLGLVGRGLAEAVAPGEVVSSRLLLVSPESAVFPIVPVPENPCWIVRSTLDGGAVLTVVDAVTGEFLGTGITPPYDAFGMSGPATLFPCSRSWSGWVIQAAQCLEDMGYTVEQKTRPPRSQVRGHIQSTETAVFYEIAHGNSEGFVSECVTWIWDDMLEASGDGLRSGVVYDHVYDPLRHWTSSDEIATWIAGYSKMPFAFLASCDAMCQTGPGTLSHAFRKGSDDGTATVGYCDMNGDLCFDCWLYSADWQDALFEYAGQGWTIRDAYRQANQDYPACGTRRCMRFAGDTLMTLVPVVKRDPLGLEVAQAGTEVDGADGSQGAVPSEVTLAVTAIKAGGTRIRFGIPHPGHVRMSVFDVRGRLVGDLVNEFKERGYHSVMWDAHIANARAIQPGVYFARLEAPAGSATAKIIITH